MGVALTGSFQEHDGGYNQATTGGWHTFTGADAASWGAIPQPGAPGSQNITNRPGPTDLYQVPQSIDFSVNGIQRERTNGQLDAAMAAGGSLTGTLDYTFAQNVVHTKGSDLSSWFDFGPSVSSWTKAPCPARRSTARPTTSRTRTACPIPGVQDIAMGGNWSAVKTTLRSLGLNLVWKPSSTLRFEADAHSSNSDLGPGQPHGTQRRPRHCHVPARHHHCRLHARFPGDEHRRLMRARPAQLVTGSLFCNSYMKSNIDQLQLKGSWDATDNSSVDFGLNVTHIKNRTAYGNVDQGTWSGATSVDDYPDSVWHPNHAVPSTSPA